MANKDDNSQLMGENEELGVPGKTGRRGEGEELEKTEQRRTE